MSMYSFTFRNLHSVMMGINIINEWQLKKRWNSENFILSEFIILVHIFWVSMIFFFHFQFLFKFQCRKCISDSKLIFSIVITVHFTLPFSIISGNISFQFHFKRISFWSHSTKSRQVSTTHSDPRIFGWVSPVESQRNHTLVAAIKKLMPNSDRVAKLLIRARQVYMYGRFPHLGNAKCPKPWKH